MKVKMKVLDFNKLIELNESSIHAARKQHLGPGQIPNNSNAQYLINFHFDHAWDEQQDVRLSIILKPGTLTAWLDVSCEEYTSIPEVELSELDWEAAVCVGVPRWVP